MRVNNYQSQKHFAIDGLCPMASSMPPVQFSASRRAQLDRKCDDLIDRALSTHDKFHAAANLGDWQRVRRRNAMNVYRPRSADGTEGPRVLLGSGIVPGTLDDALNGVYCDSTESLRICKSLLSDKFVDGAVLRVFEAHNLRAPIVFAGIKWFIMRGFAGTSGLLDDKDMLTYERMGRIVDRNGQYFSYHVLQSIDLPERPANRERGLQRVDISWCYLYRQLSPDWLGVFMLGDLDLNTVIPHSISSFISAERVLSAGNFLHCARAKRFSALMASNMGVETEKGAPHCVVCLSPPKMLGFSHKLCMGCRQNVCRKCRQRRYVFRLQLRSAKPATEYFCRLCIDKVTRSSRAKSSAKLDEVHDVLNGSRLGSSRSGDRSKAELSGSKSGFHESMRLDKLAEFTRRCHDSIAMEEEMITWNQEELLEISRFLESSSNKSRRREQRRRSGSGPHTASSQGSRRRHWSGDNSSSSATSNGRQESPPAYGGHYDYSDSPTAENGYTDETKYFEEESVESGPWTECLPNERSGKWTVVFDEDRQEYVRIRVPGLDPDSDPLGNSRIKEKPKAVCIDELD